jgi:capsular exopolysaccharide synthesis family protein
VVSLRLRKRAQTGNETGGFSRHLVAALDPTSTAAEAYRTLRASLLYAVVDEPPEAILITGPGSDEGKTTACANLGVVLAQADKKTLIIDGDLREPTLHSMFGMRNRTGVVNVLAGERDLSEVWEEPLPGLKVATSGPIPHNPTELLSSSRFAALLDQARELFDYVLIDSPPTASVSDAIIIATQADAVLLVLDFRRTRKNVLRDAVRGLEAVGAKTLGVVVNNTRETRPTYYYGKSSS